MNAPVGIFLSFSRNGIYELIRRIEAALVFAIFYTICVTSFEVYYMTFVYLVQYIVM